MNFLKEKSTHNVHAAYKKLKKILKPGDVININGYNIYYNPFNFVPHYAIRKHQRDLFEYSPPYHCIPDNDDTHTVCFFGSDKIFSVTHPKTVWETVEQQAENRFSIYRYMPFELNDKHIETMYTAAEKMIGTKYDYGQLLDIGISGILGYDHIIKLSIFDLGRKRKVCSVGVRILFEELRHDLERKAGVNYNSSHPMGIALEDATSDNKVIAQLMHSSNIAPLATAEQFTNKIKTGHYLYIDLLGLNSGKGKVIVPPMNRLFNQLNPSCWSEKQLDSFIRVDVEATSPSHFANSQYFGGKFKQVLSWKEFI